MVLDFLLCYVFIAGACGMLRVFREKVCGQQGVSVLIMGAGDGGELLLRELRNNPRLPFVPVGFVDNYSTKHGHVIHGVKVLGSRQGLTQLIRKLKVERVFISIISSPEEVFDICATMGVEC